uniref:BHLH domain-containing protein n=1 Tax=Caenorhabditis japonica TaxID=281687 RepID=A0A8R1EAP3_CAEJA
MYDVLMNLLPPSHFKVRLSRAQVLKEAVDYIQRLSDFLNDTSSNNDPRALFPQIFDKSRNSNKDAYRRPITLKEGTVHAYISRHELTSDAGLQMSAQNLYFAYVCK